MPTGIDSLTEQPPTSAGVSRHLSGCPDIRRGSQMPLRRNTSSCKRGNHGNSPVCVPVSHSNIEPWHMQP